MLLSYKSIETLVNLLSGNAGLIDSQTKKSIDVYFDELAINNLVESYEDCLGKYDEFTNNSLYESEDFKLEKYIKIKVEEINGTKNLLDFMKILIKYFSDYIESDIFLEICVYLNKEFSKDNYEIVEIKEDNIFKIYSLDDSMVSYGCYFKEDKKGQFVLINEHCDKCINKIKSKDYSGAITNSRSLLEQILREIQIDMKPDKRSGYNGKIKDLLKNVLKELDITKDLIDKPKAGYNKLKDGFIDIAEGISVLRHGMSDAHNISHIPTKRDALLAVNSSKTLANFIVEYYFENYLPRQ